MKGEVAELQSLYEYACWANARLFGLLLSLTPGEFTRPVAGSYGSIRNTLVHVLSAEAGWLDRCGGANRGPRLKPDDFPTAESLTQAWTKVEANVRAFLATLTDEDLVRQAKYVNDRGEARSMPVGELLRHSAVHGAHHRGQVALLLRLLGHAPGNFDLLIYYAEKRGVPAW